MVRSVSPNQHLEEELFIKGPAGELGGLRLTPNSIEAKSVAMIHPGFGPTDRDGNNPAGIKASAYEMLAKALADNGIASLRIDKRGMFSSAGAIKDPNDVVIADYASDLASYGDPTLPIFTELVEAVVSFIKDLE